MSQAIGLQTLNNIPIIRSASNKKEVKNEVAIFKSDIPTSYKSYFYQPISFCARLSSDEKKKYDHLLNFMKDWQVTQTSGGLSVNAQLDTLLKSGKLLEKDANDKSSILDNLFEIATTDRANGLNKKNLISNTLDAILNPAIITQNFGDIPHEDKQEILSVLDDDNPVKKNPSLMDISASGTCVAASNEVNLADKYPAEFSRWVNKLSSTDKQLFSRIKLSSISKNPLEAVAILNLLQAKIKNFSFDSVDIVIEPDPNVYLRAKNQDKNWDLGERNVADVLIQSTIMQLGSQGTYDSLTDERGGEFTTNPQGLIEIEKTFVESIIKNREINSVVHQQIDGDKRLVGYNSSFEKIKNEMINILDSGEDIILGYVLTNDSAGITKSPFYNKEADGDENQVVNGHEITVVGYRKDENNNTIFSCIDTDDGMMKKIEYSASWLIPKINHAGIPTNINKK